MISNEELKKFLLENRVDKNGNLDLIGLDFSDFDGDVSISDMRVKKDLFQVCQKVGGNLWQTHQQVKGTLRQNCQEVGKDLYQEKQNVGRNLFQDGQLVKGKIFN